MDTLIQINHYTADLGPNLNGSGKYTNTGQNKAFIVKNLKQLNKMRSCLFKRH